jgi:Fe2+ transport system protein B
MNTKILMILSAVFLGILGILFSFFPKEIVSYLNIEQNIVTILVLQILSALFLGFGILNWMAKGTLIGGIYNRPIVLGNLMHFGVGAIALAKVVSKIETNSELIISLLVVYIIFALLFGYIFRTNPSKVEVKN